MIYYDTRRLRGWDLKLIKLIDAQLNMPFDWVTSNCGHLMAASVIACHGDEHPALVELAGWTSKAIVEKHVEEAGGIDKILGRYFQRIPLLQAGQGDLCVIGTDGNHAGCVIMEGMAIGKAEEIRRSGTSAFRMPVQSALVAYKV